MIIDTLSADDTALALRIALGATRGWHDFLADCIRDKSSLFGVRLLPIAKIKKEGDRLARPVYAVMDVRNFILYALKKITRPADTKELRKIRIKIDPARMLLPIGMRSATLA